MASEFKFDGDNNTVLIDGYRSLTRTGFGSPSNGIFSIGKETAWNSFNDETGIFSTSGLSIGSLSGLLKATAGSVSVASGGTDYEPPVTKGNLTESGSSIITFGGNTSNNVLGNGTSISIHKASAAQDGYLAKGDWSIFNGKGTVTSVSVVSANGISGSVATETTTPAITIALGAITPTSVNSITLSGSSTPTLGVTGTTTVSGSNTGDNAINSTAQYYHGVVARPVGASNPLPTNLTTPVFTLGATANNISYYYQGTLVNVTSDKTTILDNGTGETTTSGSLVVGKHYKITTFVSGDDFSNIATVLSGTINTTGCIFTATGTAPTSWVNGSSVKNIATPGLYFIYFNAATGNILNGGFPGISNTSNVLFSLVNWNGTDYGLVGDERHGYTRNCEWHAWAHDTVGVRYESGITLTASGTGAAATMATTSGSIHDEDIEFVVPVSTTCRMFWQTGASTYVFDKTPSTVPFKYGVNTRPVYADSSNAYTLTQIQNNAARFINFFFYATSDLLVPIYCFVETSTAALVVNGYTTLANARAVPFPNLSGMGNSPELKPIYRVIVSGTGVVQTIAATDDYRTVSSLPQAAGTTSTTAAAVTFVPYGTIGAGNVQSALEELSDEKEPVQTKGTISSGTASAIVVTDGGSSTVGPNVGISINKASASADGYLGKDNWTTFNTKESPLTFSTGLTRATNTITSDLSTGKAGSQSVIGGTAASETLTLSSTIHGTKGKILFGTSAYDESLNLLGIGTSSPGVNIDVKAATDGFTSIRASGIGACYATISVNRATGTVATPAAVSNGNYLGIYQWAGYYDATHQIESSQIIAEAGETWQSGKYGSGIIFLNTITGGASLAERMRIRAVDGAVSYNVGIVPSANDGAYLGTTALMWSDLFLAAGAVINFNNGDVTLTHSADTLTLGGGALALGTNNLTMTGSIGATGSRVTKGWFTATESNTMVLTGSSSGTTTLQATAAAGTTTQTFQAVTGTVYCSGGTDVAYTDGGTGLSTYPTRTIILLAGGAALGTTTPATRETRQMSTNLQTVDVLKFKYGTGVTGDTTIAWFCFPIPDAFDSGTFVITIQYFNAASDSGNFCVFQAAMSSAADGEAIDVAVGTTQVIKSACSASDNFQKWATFPAITASPTPAPSHMMFIKLWRDPSHADDNTERDVYVQSLKVEFVANSYSD